VKISTKAVAVLLSITVLPACTLSPDPVSQATMTRIALEDLDRLKSEQDKPSAPLTLYDAMARALLHNRDRRVETMTAALENRQYMLANFDMLPQLAVEAGYTNRSNESGASSRSLLTNTESLEPSTSQDRESYSGSLGVMWNVLDFGVSYVRAGQQGDRYLVAKERERRVVQTLLEDVRDAYWRALSAQRLLDRVGPLAERAERALSDAQTAERSRIEAPLDSLSYQRDLLDALRTLQNLNRELVRARVDLSLLMGLLPGTKYTLAEPEGSIAIIPEDVNLQMERVERLALANRPETQKAFYEKRIAEDEVTVATLSMLPGINLNYGWNFDSNSFLFNNSWYGYGAAVSWNMFRVFTGPFEIKAAQAGEDLAEQRRLAVAMAVLAQVHLARVDYYQARHAFEIADRYATVVNRLSKRVEAQASTNRVGERDAIRENLNALLGEVQRDIALADLQTAHGRIFTSMGANPMPDTVGSMDEKTLADALEARFHAWEMGRSQLAIRAVPTQTNGDRVADAPVANAVEINPEGVLTEEHNVLVRPAVASPSRPSGGRLGSDGTVQWGRSEVLTEEHNVLVKPAAASPSRPSGRLGSDGTVHWGRSGA